MSRHELLSRQLAAHRSASTGEGLRSALPAVEGGLARLSRNERSLLATTISGITDAAASADGASPVLAEHIGQAVLPDASGRPQQELEAGIVEAASRALNDLHEFPPVSICRPARFFRAAIPAADCLTLILEPNVLGPLLTALVPHEVEDEVQGVVGLRYRLYRRHLELYLVDHPTSTKVVFAASDRAELKAGLTYTDAMFASTASCQRVDQRFPDRLSRSEQLDLSRFDRAFGPVQFTSGLLRRIAVLREGLWIRTWTHGCNSLQVEWAGESPTPADAALKLTDPITGFPGTQLYLDPTTGVPRRLVQPSGTRCPRHTSFSPPQLTFRPTSAPSPDSDDRLPQNWQPPHPGWDAWRSVATTTATRLDQGDAVTLSR